MDIKGGTREHIEMEMIMDDKNDNYHIDSAKKNKVEVQGKEMMSHEKNEIGRRKFEDEQMEKKEMREGTISDDNIEMIKEEVIDNENVEMIKEEVIDNENVEMTKEENVAAEVENTKDEEMMEMSANWWNIDPRTTEGQQSLSTLLKEVKTFANLFVDDRSQSPRGHEHAWGLYVNCSSPLVVVLSESMEPAFARGDILFLSNPKTVVDVGEIIVFKISGREIPIVHRVLNRHDSGSKPGKQLLLTKGDHNSQDDRTIYQDLPQNRDKMWVSENEIIGRVQGHLPFLGYATVMMADYPRLKYAALSVLGLFTFLYE
ncbi:Signal peptidase complex catalytic subunit [Gryganskiella cystojenkinii]|nr:Signal peptidase complex catalytic subunit [Gryganskiella cystojenkinii]